MKLNNLLVLPVFVLLVLMGCQSSSMDSAVSVPVSVVNQIDLPAESGPSPSESLSGGLSFPQKAVSPQEAKKVLDKIKGEFETMIRDCGVNEKHIAIDGWVSRIYYMGNTPIAAEWPEEELGANGGRKAYFDANGTVRAVFDSEHGSSWFQEHWYFNNLDGSVFAFSCGGDITYDENGIGQNPKFGKPIAEAFEEDEEAQGVNMEACKLKAETLLESAKELEDNRTGIYNYQGNLQFSHPAIMHLDTDEHNQVEGKYNDGKAEYRLTGKIVEECLILTEWDAKGKEKARWCGRWIELDRIEGKIENLHGQGYEYFSFSPSNGYGFK